MTPFAEAGFELLRGAVPPERVAAMRAVAERDLAADRGPIEREADVGYPGAPASLDAPGGRTVRRLLRAYDRDEVFRTHVHDPALVARIGEALGEAPVRFSPAHHNCVMTKQPTHSSDTGWHRDIRYWSFERPELVTTWLALTVETSERGSLRVVPGSHRLDLPSERFDDASFLDPEHPENQALLEASVGIELAPGDLLLFHARLLHHATRNHTPHPKLAAVFTFFGASNAPMPGTRSASLAPIAVP
ncbi:MAG: phytanoyl-CoA dioxygenase family protein [Myxococcota bacterium]